MIHIFGNTVPSCRSETANFFKSLFKIVTPIALQNLISAAVHSADVIMLGYVGQTALAAASLAGQVQFVLLLFFVGMSSGLIMLTAQYWGKKDAVSIETLTGIAFKLSCSAGLIFSLAAFFMPHRLMQIFTGDSAMIAEGAKYLKLVAPSYFCMSVSQVFQAVFKSIERVKTVTVLTISALLLNIALNAAFIFGWGIFPALAIRGVALATTIARIIEMCACIWVASRLKELHLGLSILLRKNKLLLKDFFHFALPALGNEFVWGAAFAMYSVILGHLGEDIVAANSVAGVVRNLASVLCFGMAYGGAILLGKEMGGGNLEKAKRDAGLLWRITVLAGLAGGIIIALSFPAVQRIARLNAASLSMLRWLLFVNGASVFGASVNTVLICGIFRAGGDARTGFIIDSICMWLVSVPLGLICAFVLHLPPVLVYLILYLDEFEKMPFIISHYRSGKWLMNITREF
ncbi:MAG: MATE family efflux transporter [Treponema sp.]|nr:MATE family efflux transporter [Treponema sp.]